MSKEIIFDLHSHSTCSDGKHSPQEMVNKAAELGFDVFAVTDHNFADSGLDPVRVWDEHGLVLVEGFELSLLWGHFLILDIDAKLAQTKLDQLGLEPAKYLALMSQEKLLDTLRWAVDQNGLVIAAHPCIPTGIMSVQAGFLAELHQAGLIHGAEIHNGQFERAMPRIIYRYWQESVENLLKELGIPAYSNSDTHNKRHIGNRHNAAENISPHNLIKELKQQSVAIRSKKRWTIY